MSATVRSTVIYRFSGRMFGGNLEVDAIKVSRRVGGEQLKVEISGGRGEISAVSLTLTADAAQALARELQAVASAYANSMTSTH